MDNIEQGPVSAGEWIAWGSGLAPLPLDSRVDIRTRSGREDNSVFVICCGWIHHGWDDDVLAYRVVSKP